MVKGHTGACAPAHRCVGSYSIIVELENAATVSLDEVRDVLSALADQVCQLSRIRPNLRAEVLFVHARDEQHNSRLLDQVRQQVPSLSAAATVRFLSLPEGRYYQLKNVGIAAATGEIIIILDSDAVPQPLWLQNILEPFQNRSTVAVNGYTYLSYSDFISRTFALIWFFPLRDRDVRFAERRSLNVNNCAFLASWLKQNPFSCDFGFKVDCTLLSHEFQKQGHTLIRAPAYAAHAPLRGWRFLVWRARVTGRDADRKFRHLKSSSMVRRFVHALLFWYRMERRACTRVLRLHRQVAMPVWELPSALLLAITFYSLCFLAQLEMLLGVAHDRPEHIPAYAEHH